jgi:hypothetical protein
MSQQSALTSWASLTICAMLRNPASSASRFSSTSACGGVDGEPARRNSVIACSRLRRDASSHRLSAFADRNNRSTVVM